jgi:hypothetical protein
METSNGLDKILQQIRTTQDKPLALPPCPYCRRTLRTNVGYYVKSGKRVASIALWCSACTAATAALDVDPIPPWAQPTDFDDKLTSAGG